MAYSRDLENTDRKVEKPGRVRKQATEVHCRAIATAGDETLFPGRKILGNGIHSPDKGDGPCPCSNPTTQEYVALYDELHICD